MCGKCRKQGRYIEDSRAARDTRVARGPRAARDTRIARGSRAARGPRIARDTYEIRSLHRGGIGLLVMVTILSIVMIGIRVYSNVNSDETRIQEGIAKEIIRFHVRANSDSEEDQALKLQVKDAVVTYLQPILADSSDIHESREILSEHEEEIKEVALDTLQEAGSDDPVSVYFEESYFPMKTYGDVTFPPGNYEAFRVDIGDHAGKNWWCVLYPPLCFVDAVYGVVPDDSKAQLADVLTEEEYQSVMSEKSSGVKLRFKYLTFLNWMFE